MKHRFRVAAIAALSLISACRHTAPEETETETPVAVQVEEARSGPVREVIAATGLVTAAPGAELVVTAPEAARIVELPKAEGDRVRTGDLLVRFEIPSLTAGATSSHAASERSFPATRTKSPWIDACTLSLLSLIFFTISRAFSVGMPCCSVISCFTVEPAEGMISP